MVYSQLTQALRRGILVALLAPAVSAVAGAAATLLAPASNQGFLHLNPTFTSFIVLSLLYASSMYVQVAFPGFLAGIALTAMRNRFSPVGASFCCGLIGVSLHTILFFPLPLSNALSPFIGITLAAYVAEKCCADA